MSRKYISKFFQFPLRNPGPFVYYQSLLSHQSFGAQVVGGAATKYLFGASNILNSQNYHERITQALLTLSVAADEESRKEQLFLEHLNRQLTDKGLKNLPNIQTDPYGFINTLNEFLRGADQYKKELEEERKRIHIYRYAINKYGNPKQIAKVIKEDSDNKYNAKELADALRNISNTIEGRSGNNSSFTTYKSSVKNNSLAGKMAETIIGRAIQKFGSSLIDIKGKKFLLNGRQANAMITLITNEIERRLKANKQDITLETIKDIQSGIEQGEYDDIISQYTNINQELSLTLESFSNATIKETQYSALLGNKRTRHAREVLSQRTKDPLKNFLDTVKADEETKKQLSKELSQLSKEWAAAALSVQPAIYFNAEADLGSLLAKADMAALFTGGTTKDDVGSIVVSIDDETLDSDVISKLKTTIYRIQSEQMKSNKYKKGLADEYEKNAENALKAIEEIEQAYEDAANELNMSIQELKELTDAFVVHGNVKSYDTISAKTEAFSGGSIGSNITEQLTNFAQLINMAGYGSKGLTDYDSDWLLSAIINTGNGLIGQENKEGLEKYFSAFAGMLLFDDAQLMLGQGINSLTSQIGGTTLEKIHLYSLNGTVVPCSYVLYETYESLTNELNNIDYTGEHGIKVTIHARGAEGGPFSEPEDWLAEREAAIEEADIQVQFMGKFLGFLDNLARAINPG